MSTPVSAVQSVNPHKGVKRPLLGNPTTVPGQLPGFRGRVVDAGGPIKAPKLRNGNVNNETSNVRIPYSRVCPLEFLSSFQGRLGPGDVIFTHKYPPGFVKASAAFNNATLGVNTLSRVVGLDGLNRLLMQSGPNGWRLGENVFEVHEKGGALSVVNTDGTFELTTLSEYTLDGVVISNDEPGAFTSSGSRDNVLFNVAIQGPVETNNGFLKYEPEQNPNDRNYSQYNPLTGAINSRTVEAHARGSAESGTHVENQPMPGRVGNQFAINQGKTDYVANYCGTYSAFPSQMFDRRVEILNTLYLGLRAYELSRNAKRQLTNADGRLRFPASVSDPDVDDVKCYFYQYLPFSSRAAAVIQAVSDTVAKMKLAAPLGGEPDRADAAKKVGAVKQQTETQLPSSKFDNAAYDPIRTEDLRNMVGAWRVGRVMDTKASVHDRYAGGPRDTAFSCMVDIGIAWRNVKQATVAENSRSKPTGFLLPPSEGGYVQRYGKDGKPIDPPPRPQKSGQQDSECLANNLAPPLSAVIGSDFGKEANISTALTAAEREARDAKALEDEEQRLKEEAKALENLQNQAVGQATGAAFAVLKDLKKNDANDLVRAVLNKEEFGTDPMVNARGIFSSVAGVIIADTKSATEDAWNDFVKAKFAYKPGDSAQGVVKDKRVLWQQGVLKEIKSLIKQMPVDANKKAKVIATLKPYPKALLDARKAILKLKEEKYATGDFRAQVEVELGRFLNRANHFNYIFTLMARELQGRAFRQTPNENMETSTDHALLDDAELMEHLLHFSALCDLHAQYIDIDDPRFSAPAAAVAPVARAAPAPAPTGVAPVSATPAAVAAGVKAPAKRGKTPTRARAAPTGAAGAAAASSSSAAAPAVAVAPVPAAAAGVSSTPLVPTGAPVEAAPRRRARDTGESVTNSLFENMFRAAPTDAAADEPASPTPSSGSEGPTSGPRTFRRQR